MQTRKSGIMALIAGAVILGACENKAPIVNIPPVVTPVTVTISPNPVPELKKGQTIQLIAVVSGNANQSVTWSLASGTGVATVSSTGLVTAVAPGNASVVATSVADATAKAAVAISVADTATGGGTTVGQPSITIGSVTQFGTLFPVNPGNVAGTVDVTMNVDIPTGVVASAVRTTIDGTEVCRQSFSSSGSADLGVEGAQVPQVIVCTINTASVKADGTPNFLNGTHTLKAEVVGPTGAVLASATYQPLVFNNIDVINAVVTTTKGPAADAGGLSWRGGDVNVTLVPSIYTGSVNAVTSMTVSLRSSGSASIQGGPVCNTILVVPVGCAAVVQNKTDATASDGFAVTFAAGTRFGAGGAGFIEDPNVTVTVTGLTAAGNNFAGFAAITMSGNPIGGLTPLRLDNLAPRVTNLDITPATLGCAPSTSCYVNGAFTFADGLTTATAPATVDYGVDSETLTFQAGTSSTTLVTVATGADLAETPVAQTYLLAAIATDLLGNTRTVFATNQADCVSSSSTSVAAANLSGPCAVAPASIQKFGVDLTPPTLTLTGGPANNGANDGVGPYTFAFVDAGVGPSGFSANPVRIKVEQFTPAATTCFGDAGAANATCAFVADDGNVTIPGTAAYYRTTVYVVDQAGNVSSQIVRVTLIDAVAPVVGGIVAPSTIAGGSSPTFTAAGTDNIELGDVQAALSYSINQAAPFAYVLGFDTQDIGTYGFDVFTNSTTISYTLSNFIRSIEPTLAGGRPAGAAAITNAGQIEFDVRDVAGVTDDVGCVVDGPSCDVTQQTLNPNVTPNATSWTTINTTFASANAAHGNFTQNGPSNATICNDGSCAAASKTSTVLSAQVTGPNTTFGNPFSRVVFFYQDANFRWQVIGEGSVAITDNTVTATRTITYSLTWTAPGLAAGVSPLVIGYPIMALGIDASGRALQADPNQVVNVTNN